MEWVIKGFDELTVPELYEILSLRNEVFVVEQKCPYQDIDGRDQFSRHLFALDGQGAVCAYARILEKGQTFDTVSIGRVIVRRDMRGTGLAKEMMQTAIHFVLKTMNEQVIKIAAQAHLQNFYGSVGFVPFSDVYLEDGIPHIDMIYSETCS